MKDDPKLKVIYPKKYKNLNDCCTFAAVGQNGQYCNYQGQNNVKIRVSVHYSVHTKTNRCTFGVKIGKSMAAMENFGKRDCHSGT